MDIGAEVTMLPLGLENWRRGIWGVILIGLGIVLLLDQLDLLQLHMSGLWWPAIPIVLGAVRVITAERLRHISEGVTFILLGLWFFACSGHWFGLSYHKGWPLLLVIFGADTFVEAVLDRAGGAPAEKEEHHAP